MTTEVAIFGFAGIEITLLGAMAAIGRWRGRVETEVKGVIDDVEGLKTSRDDHEKRLTTVEVKLEIPDSPPPKRREALRQPAI